MNDVEKVKLALGLKDSSMDDLLKLYLEDAKSYLRLLLSLNDYEPIPDAFNAIVRGAAVKRFNKFKNEGMSSYSQNGESITFEANDFDEWKNEIQQYRKDHDKSGYGVNVAYWDNLYDPR